MKTHTQIHTSNKKLNTKPYFLRICFTVQKKWQPKSKTVNHQSVKKDCMHVCQTSRNKTENQLAQNKLKTIVNSHNLEGQLQSSLELKNKLQHSVLRHQHHHIQHPFSASQVGADSRVSIPTANRLLRSREKGLWHM